MTSRTTIATLDLDAIHKALSNPIRRTILAQLREPERHFSDRLLYSGHGVSAGELGKHCGLSQSTASVHLSTLLRAGLLTSSKIGQWIFYSRNEETIQAFLGSLHSGL